MKTRMKQLAIVILALFFFAACNNAKKDKDVIKIGVILPFTGELATYGNDAKRGIEIAVNEINAQGGINGKNVEIYSDDSKGESKTAVNIMNKLISVNKVQLFIGDISSTVTLSLVPVAEDNKVFLFSPCAATPKLTNCSKYFGRNWPSNNAEATSAADYILSNYTKNTNVVIVYVNNDWGLGLMQSFENRFISQGGKIKSKLIYEYENKEFKTLITKLISIKPDVVYLAGNQQEMGHFIKQLREINKAIPVVANTSFLEPDCMNIAGQSSEGIVVATPYYNPEDTTNKKVKNFTTEYKNMYKLTPSLTAANGYDAVYLFKEAIEKNSFDIIKIADFIRNLKHYHGASGIVSFTDGDVELQTVYKIIKNGEPQILK